MADDRELARARLQKQSRVRRPGEAGAGLWNAPKGGA